MSANMRPVAVRGDPQHRDAGRHRRPAALTAGGIDYATPTGRMFADILAALADYERALMHGRAPAARTAARLRGRHTGRRSSHRRRPDSAEPCAGGESIYELVRGHGVSDDRLPGATRQRPGAASA